MWPQTPLPREAPARLTIPMVGMVRRVVWMAVGAAALGGALLSAARLKTPPSRAVPSSPPGSAEAGSGEHPPQTAGAAARTRAFRVPTGQAPALSCEAARAVIAQARSQLAYPPEAVDAKSFAEAAADWLDPYGLWSVAPDAP